LLTLNTTAREKKELGRRKDVCWTVVRSELGKVMLIGDNAVRSVFNFTDD
jgi:hypothetical protein